MRPRKVIILVGSTVLGRRSVLKNIFSHHVQSFEYE